VPTRPHSEGHGLRWIEENRYREHQQLQSDTPRLLAAVVRGLPGGGAFAARPCAARPAPGHRGRGPARVPPGRKGHRSADCWSRGGPFHRPLREFSPPDELGREGIDRPARVPDGGATVPGTVRSKKASPRGPPVGFPAVPALPYDVPDLGADRSPRGLDPASSTGPWPVLLD